MEERLDAINKLNVPAEVKDAVAAAHGNHEPPDSPIRAGELV